MFKPLRTRDDLLALVKAHAPTKACASAIEQGRAIVLGGFMLGPDGCYVTRVSAKFGQVWYVVIKVDETDRKHEFFVSSSLDTRLTWENWIGQVGGKRPLIDGDQHKPEWKELYAQRTPQKTPAA